MDELRDRRSQEEPRGSGHTNEEDLLLRVERDRAVAAADRARAAEDRAKAAADRQEAIRERDEAFLAQAEARHDLLLAATDELTGAFTRKFGLENISREIERARRTQDSMLLAFVDVDGLKELNDTRGHSDGDRLLRHVVDKIRANVRAYDVIVRYGGDEFLCALPHLDLTVARNRMEKIAEELTAEDSQHSIAFGLAEYDQVGGLDELIARADTQLLEAKRSHKHRD
jgi:diguanylate cyclase (GGDEF)-like protein